MRNLFLFGWAAAFAAILISSPAAAGISGQTPLGESYASFLEVAQGARPAGMGDAYVAVADDITSVFWNVAGLTKMARNRFQFTFTNTQWIADTQFNSGAVGINTNYGAIAFSFVALDPGDIEERTIFQPDGTGRMVDNGSWAFGLAYAKQFTDRMSVGGQGRIFEERLDTDYGYRVFDLAVGGIYHTGFRSLRIAMSLRNFGKDKVLLSDEQSRSKMPVIFNVAAAAEVLGTKEDPVYLTGAFEALYNVAVEKRIHVGGELWLRNILALRGGYKWNYDAQDFTVGAGLKLQRGVHYLQADIAWVDFGKDFGAPLRVSVTGSF
jgi:hypothetical protein